ncbi:MAG TPA: DedA family protein [Thermoanaerobaculia bacterium]|nr:DedA family protein [Thermoanaerobaculia bacterium]HUM31051.1 DedA family protein [Thermoanaerobaculia bacterium]HXK69349.1 DedA family protein [Thermoanaerobaculia bacterium]
MDLGGLDLTSLSTFGIFTLLFLGAFGPTLPEEVILVIAGYLVHQGYLEWWTILPVAFFGIVISDNLLYLIGSHFGARVLRNRFVQKVFTIRRQRWVRRLFFRYKYSLFFLGRYFYGLRPAILLFAGLTRVRWSLFFLMDLASAAINTVLWIFLGYLFAPVFHHLLNFIRTFDLTILLIIIGIVTYYITEVVLLKLNVLREDQFPVKITAPYKIFSLALLIVLLKVLAHLLHRSA